MDDLIRRQDAVNELSYCQTYLFDSRDHDKKISLEDEEQEWCEPTRGYSFFYPIIAWMPLVHPEPYKGE